MQDQSWTGLGPTFAKINHMDYELRRLQRLASDGDPNAASKLLSLRVRAGLNPHYVRQAAALGDSTALSLFEPAPPTNPYCNYDAGSLGFNAIDGVLGGIWNREDLIAIAVAFVRHTLDASFSSEFRQGIAACDLLELGELWVVGYEKHLMEESYSYQNLGQGEWYIRHQASKAMQEKTRKLKENAQDLFVMLRNLILQGSESEIRWAAAYVSLLIQEQYKPQLKAVWAAEHCRRAAGDGSEASQRQELEWQRQFLIRWLLH